MKIKDFIKRLDSEVPGQYKTFPPLNYEEFEAWHDKFPDISLPEDLLDLLKQTNGIQFGVNEGSPEGYFQILPLCKINFARKIMWGDYATAMGEYNVPYSHWLAITEHQDNACYVVLDTDWAQYYYMDTCGADLKCPAGTDIEKLLDFIWKNWIEGM
jgi:hypothetical protein